MTYARKVVLQAPPWNSPKLNAFVEDCLRDGVRLICVYGDDCERVHDVIDELVVGDGSDETRWLKLLTTWHTDETLEEVMEFAESVEFEELGEVQVVRLTE